MSDRKGFTVLEAKGHDEGSTNVFVAETLRAGMAASLAWQLAERWGMVAAKADGEDSAGRQKLAVLTPEELTERACVTAELMMLEFEKRDWLVVIPAPKVGVN